MRVKVTESQIVKVILLMEEILHQVTGSLSHYLQLFLYIPGGSPDFWTINSGSTDRFNQKCWPSVLGDSSMHPYQRTPMGNPSLSPIFSGYLWVITTKQDLPRGIFFNAWFFPLKNDRKPHPVHVVWRQRQFDCHHVLLPGPGGVGYGRDEKRIILP